MTIKTSSNLLFFAFDLKKSTFFAFQSLLLLLLSFINADSRSIEKSKIESFSSSLWSFWRWTKISVIMWANSRRWASMKSMTNECESMNDLFMLRKIFSMIDVILMLTKFDSNVFAKLLSFRSNVSIKLFDRMIFEMNKLRLLRSWLVMNEKLKIKTRRVFTNDWKNDEIKSSRKREVHEVFVIDRISFDELLEIELIDREFKKFWKIENNR